MNIKAKAAVSLVIVHLLGFGVMSAISEGAPTVAGVAVPIWLFLGIFGLQWLAFIPAYFKQTEHFFDLTGAATYILATIGALLLSGPSSAPQLLVAALVVIWASRLGSFLFTRIRRDGKDGRFDDIKPVAIRFLNVWALQGLWVTLTMASALTILTDTSVTAFHPFMWVGFLMWVVGFAVEVISDRQKSAFRKGASNKEAFIQHGLWAYSRHPNYVGEISLWLGITLMAFPALNGWQWVGIVSPIFVFLLLRFVSGVPMLEKRADAKWGGQPDYEAYKARTPVLFGIRTSESKALDGA